jgi:hypothetical protein
VHVCTHREFNTIEWWNAPTTAETRLNKMLRGRGKVGEWRIKKKREREFGEGEGGRGARGRMNKEMNEDVYL